jgi:glycosyltransferase involved in cell wall biosynthesis
MMGREVHQRDAFNIRIYGSELEKLIPNYKHKCIDHRRHLVFDDKILIPISNIVESTFDGDVYNLSTTDMTFLTPFVVHNCGTPTVVVPSGGWNESTAHGYNGFFANTDDEFCHFIRRIDEIHPEDCRKQAEHFDYKIMGKNYVKLFEEIISGGGW